MEARQHRAGRVPTAWLAALPVIVTAILFYPVTRHYFFGDDLLSLYRIANWGFTRFVFTPYAGHVLVLRNALFALCFDLFGTEPRYYFYLALLTHLLNVYLSFRVIESLTGSARLGCFGAVLWGASPVNEGTIGWYAVYGQTLVATSALWLVLRFVRAAHGEAPSRAELCAWLLLVVATSTLFGTGIGVALAMPIVALLLLPSSRVRRRALLSLGSAAALVPVLYFGLQSLAAALGWGSAFASVPATVAARWPVMVDIFARLLGRGAVSLFLGTTTAALNDPLPLAILALLAALVALAAVVGGKAARRLLAACLAAACIPYALIALGRGGMVAEGLKIGVILSAERYHYCGPLFLAIAVAASLGVAGQRWRPPRAAGDVLLAVSLLALVWGRAQPPPPHDAHALARRFTLRAVDQIRATIDAAPRGDLYIELPKNPFFGVGPMLVNRPGRFPTYAAVFIVFFPSNVVNDRHVHFVTDQLPILIHSPEGIRTKDLIVRWKEVPAGHPVVELRG